MRVVPRSLRARLAAVFAVASTLLVVTGGFGLYTTVTGKAEQRVEHELRSRTTAIFTSLAKGKLPDNEVYAEVITPLGAELHLGPLIRRGEDILSQAQLDFVVQEGQLQIVRDVPALGGRSKLLAVRGIVNASQVVVVVGASLEDVKAGQARLVTTMAIGGPLFVGLLTLSGWLLAGAALKPVRRMTNEAAAISSADLSHRLSIERSTHEIAHLGSTLNAMLDRLDSSFQRERTFVDDASHELRTPLAIMSGELELALLHPGSPTEQRETIQSVHEEVQRLSAMAEDLLVLARAGSGQVPRRDQLIDVTEAAKLGLERIRSTLPDRLELRVVGDECIVAFDPRRFERVITNLLTNAIRYARTRVDVLIETEGAGRAVFVRVNDDGPGFPEEFLPHAFDRFARGDTARTRAGAGTGIGLAIVKALVEAQGGSVTATNGGPLGGAVVSVHLLR